MKLLITGISGFCGSHLAEHLLEQGHTVSGVAKSADQLQNLRTLTDKLEIELADINDPARIAKVVSAIEPDIIYHLAAESSPHRSFRNPAGTVRTNVLGTLHVLEAARNLKKVPRMLVITSAEVYGNVKPEETPLRETLPLRPVHPYGFSKVAVHFLAYQYVQMYQLPIIEGRSFNHIGPRQSLDFVVPDFAKQLAEIKLGIQNAEVSVGDLSAQRDFTDVRDVVRAYQLLAERGKTGEVYQVCSGRSYSVQQLLDMLISIADVDVKVIVHEKKLRPVAAPLIVGSAEKIENEFGWKPMIPLRKSLMDTFEYWLERVKALKKEKTTA